MYKPEHILAYACLFFTALPIFCIYLMFLGRWIKKKWYRDNERIGRECLMIQLEKVRKQRDEIASQLMAVRLNQKPNSNEPEPQGHKEFDDFLKEENKILKDAFVELNREYSQSQRELDGFKSVSKEFIKNFELDYVFNGEIVDSPSEIMVNHYNNLKSILK